MSAGDARWQIVAEGIGCAITVLVAVAVIAVVVAAVG